MTSLPGHRDVHVLAHLTLASLTTIGSLYSEEDACVDERALVSRQALRLHVQCFESPTICSAKVAVHIPHMDVPAAAVGQLANTHGVLWRAVYVCPLLCAAWQPFCRHIHQGACHHC
jgi:hypothetical protein